MGGKYDVIEVNTPAAEKDFLRLPLEIYKDDPNWIRPLDQDIRNVFSPAKNKYFRHGEAIRWILKDDGGQVVGRVAAFINRPAARKYEYPVGGMGFFESIREREVAFTLFDLCKEWLEARGMKAMDGPINFGERDRFWGLLVEGFEEPGYGVNYNPPYYKEYFEAYGFRNYFNQLIYHRTIEKGALRPAMLERARRLLTNPDYSFGYLPKERMKELPEMVRSVFNKAWARFPGVPQMSSGQAKIMYKSLKPILDEKLLWFGYYKNEPVSFFLMIPEINQVLKYMNGKLNLVNKLRFLWYKDVRKVIDKAVGFLFGVVPEHRGKGVEAAMIHEFSKVAYSESFQYKELEMNWIADYNPPMMKVLEQIGATVTKTLVTYRYIFDPSIEFRRAALVNTGKKRDHDR
jgi:GNAT superfamily N-acetyltransferase